MSLKRKNVISSPSGSRVRQAFKSPFRSPCSSNINARQDREDVNSILTHSKTPNVGHLNKNEEIFNKRCERQETPDKIKMQTPHKSQLKEGSISNLAPQRIAEGRSPQAINICHRKVVPQRFTAPFRSPNRSPVLQQSAPLDDQLAQLRRQEAELDEEIASLKNSGYMIEELQGHIDNLHRYNEIKDAAQLVMGRLAELDGVTIREIHEKYEVSTLE